MSDQQSWNDRINNLMYTILFVLFATLMAWFTTVLLFNPSVIAKTAPCEHSGTSARSALTPQWPHEGAGRAAQMYGKALGPSPLTGRRGECPEIGASPWSAEVAEIEFRGEGESPAVAADVGASPDGGERAS
jgi:hypothetical protein